MDIYARAKKIELLLCDVDGTLTDAGVTINGDDQKIRTFSIRDGLGIYLWKNYGFKFGFITGDDSLATRERARMLRADYEYYNCLDKEIAIAEIAKKSGLALEQMAFIGDDLIDIPVLRRVGLGVGVGDCVEELSKCIHYKTKAFGGKGAVRETIELIFKSKGMWEEIVQVFYNR